MGTPGRTMSPENVERSGMPEPGARSMGQGRSTSMQGMDRDRDRGARQSEMATEDRDVAAARATENQP